MVSHPPVWECKLEIRKGNRAITEAILSLIVPILFCQVSLPPFNNPRSATAICTPGKVKTMGNTSVESHYITVLQNGKTN